MRELPLPLELPLLTNTESIIQVGGHTPRVILLDTGAQLVILGIQFANKMGFLVVLV